ncbi:phosphotransferase [Amylibacter sp. SFDW26]|uniref:aminoglycoside phosphotransferase family protein n=1 Tax=Amylibacter sp. SFDW26 TaxID=2652722 RepID=UPI00126295A4|nr:phosphotransferase [Amylibacter sp. SFDW26]KAB7614620.1 phosphotransferase [Amylibacter sp. SFDW26]
MTNRAAKKQTFLKHISWDDAVSVMVAGDASNRSYDRLTKSDGRKAILMNAPPEKGEDVRPFVKVLNILVDHKLSAPKLLASDETNGFLLLEDLGDDLFARICARDQNSETVLYKAAIDVLLSLHGATIPDGIPPYDMATYLRETDLVTDWYLPAISGQETSDDLTAAYRDHIREVCGRVENKAPVLVLRDYHAENLLWMPKRNGVRNVGLLDFQDALMGHPAYDLVSLLEDARRDTSLDLQNSMKCYFIKQSGANADAFNYAYAAIGAQRNLKIIGIFARLCVRDGKPHYVDLIPRVWDHLQHDLAHPELADLKAWVAAHIPTPTPEILSQIKEAAHAA